MFSNEKIPLHMQLQYQKALMSFYSPKGTISEQYSQQLIQQSDCSDTPAFTNIIQEYMQSRQKLLITQNEEEYLDFYSKCVVLDKLTRPLGDKIKQQFVWTKDSKDYPFSQLVVEQIISLHNVSAVCLIKQGDEQEKLVKALFYLEEAVKIIETQNVKCAVADDTLLCHRFLRALFCTNFFIKSFGKLFQQEEVQEQQQLNLTSLKSKQLEKYIDDSQKLPICHYQASQVGQTLQKPTQQQVNMASISSSQFHFYNNFGLFLQILQNWACCPLQNRRNMQVILQYYKDQQTELHPVYQALQKELQQKVEVNTSADLDQLTKSLNLTLNKVEIPKVQVSVKGHFEMMITLVRETNNMNKQKNVTFTQQQQQFSTKIQQIRSYLDQAAANVICSASFNKLYKMEDAKQKLEKALKEKYPVIVEYQNQIQQLNKAISSLNQADKEKVTLYQDKWDSKATMLKVQTAAEQVNLFQQTLLKSTNALLWLQKFRKDQFDTVFDLIRAVQEGDWLREQKVAAIQAISAEFEELATQIQKTLDRMLPSISTSEELLTFLKGGNIVLKDPQFMQQNWQAIQQYATLAGVDNKKLLQLDQQITNCFMKCKETNQSFLTRMCTFNEQQLEDVCKQFLNNILVSEQEYKEETVQNLQQEVEKVKAEYQEFVQSVRIQEADEVK